MFRPLATAGTLLVATVLAGCGGVPDGTQAFENGVVLAEDSETARDVARASATGPGTAFGLTATQIDDAEIVTAAGVELAEVEDVITDDAGAITTLIVEVGDTDRDVQLPLDGLRAVRNGDDWDLQTSLTAEQLLRLPDEPASTRR